MNHITKEQAMALVGKVKTSKYTSRHYPEKPAYTLYADALNELCNAAIEWYIEQAVSKLTGTDYKMPQVAKEPVAYFDFQEHGFYWAPNVKVGDVPVSIKVAPMPLYSDLYKKDQKIDTSQERVYETAKSEQMPLTDEQCDIVLQRLDRWARDYDGHEYGLPLMLLPLRARDVLREALGEKA